MKRVMTLLFAIVTTCTIPPAASPVFASPAGDQSPSRSEKEARTPAQQKINSQILQEIYRRHGQAKEKDVPPGPSGVRLDEKDRALIDVRAEVTPALQKKLRDMGSTIVSTSREYLSTIAWVPVLKIERLAADKSVRAIEPAAEATTHK
jgi:hypothetical protein